MLDPKEGLTPEVEPKEPEKDPNDQKDPKEPEVKDEGEDIDPPVRKPSEIDRHYEQMEQEKWRNKVEFDLRKLREENRKLKGELGQTDSEPQDSQEPYKESYGSQDKLLADLEKKERLREVKDFVKDNPDYKELEKSLPKFVNHPAYLDVPVDFIAKALSAERSQRLGAEKALEAQKEAKMSKTGGHPFTPKDKKEKNWADPNEVSNEEFEKELAKVKSQQRS